MKNDDNKKMTPEEKERHYKEAILPAYKNNKQEVPWFLEPDAFEGWK